MMPGRRKLGLTAIITMTNNLRRGDDISISPPSCECDTLMREWPDGLLRLITVIVSLMGQSLIKSVSQLLSFYEIILEEMSIASP